MQAQFREMEGGYHRANVELKAYLRDGWVLPALPVLVEESAAALGEGASKAARREHAGLCRSVALAHACSPCESQGQMCAPVASRARRGAPVAAPRPPAAALGTTGGRRPAV